MSTLRERNAERLRKSMAGEKIDAHAVFNFYTFPFYHKHSGVDLKQYFKDPKLMLEVQLEVLAKIDNCGNIGPDVGAVAETSALGGEVRFNEHGFISIHERTDLEDSDDLGNIAPLDAHGDNYMHTALTQLEYLVANCPSGMKVNPHPIMGAFTIGAQLRGISDFCADTLADPEFVDGVLERCVEAQITFIQEQEKIFKNPLHHVLIADDLAAFLNPDMFKELIVPLYQKLHQTFPNTQFWLHNDSTTSHIVNQIPDLGVVAWQSGPVIEGYQGVMETENKVSVMGGLNPVELAGYDVDKTIEVCTALLKSFKGNPRCVMSTAGSINQVPLENIRAMMDLADKFKS